tara:strand:- start:3391 stop:3627 length:237 start_codon:yes stop_codon:yes gene_type:complete
MNVYWVIGQDPYVERDGSVDPPVRFGPWARKVDAEQAAVELSKQTQGSYGSADGMPAYENINVCESMVLTAFHPNQIY